MASIGRTKRRYTGEPPTEQSNGSSPVSNDHALSPTFAPGGPAPRSATDHHQRLDVRNASSHTSYTHASGSSFSQTQPRSRSPEPNRGRRDPESGSARAEAVRSGWRRRPPPTPPLWSRFLNRLRHFFRSSDPRARNRLLALAFLSLLALIALYTVVFSGTPDGSPSYADQRRPIAIDRALLSGVWEVHYSDGDSNRYVIDGDGFVHATSSKGEEKVSRLKYLSSTVFRLEGIYDAPAFEEVVVTASDDTGATQLSLTHFYKPREVCCTAVAMRTGLLDDIDSSDWAYLTLSDNLVGARDVVATVVLHPPISIRNKPEISVLMRYFKGDAKLNHGGGFSANHLSRHASLKENRKYGEVVTIANAAKTLEPKTEYSFQLSGIENPSMAGRARVYIECGVLLANFTLDIVDSKPDRVVAVGDLHGDIAKARRVLQWQGLINDDDHWTGGAATLVQTGDLVDRGPYSFEVLQLFHNLRSEAPSQGGHVELLLGNHEVMWLQNNWQYLHPDDKLRKQELPDRIPKVSPGKQGSGNWAGGSAAELMLTCQIAFSRNDTVFVHGGIAPEWAEKGVDSINELFHRALLTDPVHSILGESGPLWLRKFSTGEYHCDELKESLKLLGKRRMVVGHSVQHAGVPSMYCGGSVYAIDVAMSDYMSMKYEPASGHMAVLEILDGTPHIHVFEEAEEEGSTLRKRARRGSEM